VGMIEGLYQRIIQEHSTAHGSQDMTCVAIGGLASLFSQDLSLMDHVNETLTLDSLAEIYTWLTRSI